jgi:hypothetical protein
METISCKVDDLSASDRAALEHLLGQALNQDQYVSVIAYKARETDNAVREAARQRIVLLLDRAAKHAAEHGMTAEEADAAVDEAMEVIRHGSVT